MPTGDIRTSPVWLRRGSGNSADDFARGFTALSTYGGLLILQMSGFLTLLVPIITIQIGYTQMYLFGGLVSEQ